jgi:hypothetical protein
LDIRSVIYQANTDLEDKVTSYVLLFKDGNKHVLKIASSANFVFRIPAHIVVNVENKPGQISDYVPKPKWLSSYRYHLLSQ